MRCVWATWLSLARKLILHSTQANDLKVNRGGLFPVNDGTFTFFVAVEVVTRQDLHCQYNSEKHENIKQLMIKAISEDCDVQFLHLYLRI